jgi:hypothetical protein
MSDKLTGFRSSLGMLVFLGILLCWRSVFAQSSKGEAEYLVPPQGGAVDVPVHAGAVCVLSFPEKLGPEALTSSSDFEIKEWGAAGIAVRAAHAKVPAATLALATAGGGIKINVTLHVVPDAEPALTMVRLKAASAEEAFEAQVKAGIEQRVAPIERRLDKARKDLDALIRQRAEEEIADRMLSRNEIVRIESHARNRDHVILHVRRGLLFGGDGFLIFEIENRSRSAYRLASVRVLSDGRNVAGATRLASAALARDPSLIGVVAPGATARGVVTVRSVMLNRALALELAQPDGRGVIRADRGIVLR